MSPQGRLDTVVYSLLDLFQSSKFNCFAWQFFDERVTNMDSRFHGNDGNRPSSPAPSCHPRLRPGIQDFMDPRIREDDE